MFFLFFLDHFAIAIALATACYALSKWGSPRTLFFTCYAISVAVCAAGALLKANAHDFGSALTAVKIGYFGIPYIAPFFYLFCRDYANLPPYRRFKTAILFIFPMLCTVFTNSWPFQRWFWNGILPAPNGGAGNLDITYGPLYYLSMAYNIALMAASAFTILRYYLQSRSKVHRHLFVFLVACAFPLCCQILFWAGTAIFEEIIPAALALSSAILGLYVIRYRSAEWSRIGRAMVVQQMRDAFILTDEQGRFLDANTAATAFFPELAEVKQGQSVLGLARFPAQLIDGNSDTCDFTLTIDKETHYIRASRSVLVANGKTPGISILLFDDTENHRLMDELQQIATHDALTGLFTRGIFFQTAGRDYDLCVRKYEDGSILMIDIDYFKKVNDTYGHQVGDQVLVAAAGVLHARLRHTDIAGRYGGEELAVWLPGAAAEGAAIIADVLRRAIEHTVFESEQGTFHVTISIGVAGLNHARPDGFESLVNQADQALYQAKRGGRNRVCVYEAPPKGGAKEPARPADML